ncbi:aldo/keto reductase [Acidisphaera sp. L21]|uniref:aldo/keto reductase n=1 Tax=Acidisphaera sp. L21 TaxID=1641851 RepID=UPI00131A78B2|nr:aldo/keto reductase [Acidisphaera sp. L21]
MQIRAFGPEGMPVSLLGFGCGAVGGLMVRGSTADQERAVARALDVGITYFDTAVQYGDGASETHLGAILRKIGRAALVGTKVRLRAAEFGSIGAAITASIDGSLRRLQRDDVDIFHLHNAITTEGGGESLSVRQVMEEVVPAFEALRSAGKLRLLGLTAVGETAALLQVIDSGKFGSAQVSYNMLNPSAGQPLPADYPAQDYGRLFDHTTRARTGVVGIRVLAGGALSGSAERHKLASPAPAPIGSALSYQADVDRAARLRPLVDEGFAGSLPEAAIRFAIAHPAMGTILVGMASVDEFEGALAAVQKGPLPPAALQRVAELTAGFAGESR